MQVAISEILELKKRLNEINSVPLKDIDFLDDHGNKIETPDYILEDFCFTGLNNTDFILTEFYKTGWTNLDNDEL